MYDVNDTTIRYTVCYKHPYDGYREGIAITLLHDRWDSGLVRSFIADTTYNIRDQIFLDFYEAVCNYDHVSNIDRDWFDIKSTVIKHPTWVRKWLRKKGSNIKTIDNH